MNAMDGGNPQSPFQEGILAESLSRSEVATGIKFRTH